MTIAELLTKRRYEMRLSEDQFADYLGISVDNLKRYKRTEPGKAIGNKIYELLRYDKNEPALGMSVADELDEIYKMMVAFLSEIEQHNDSLVWKLALCKLRQTLDTYNLSLSKINRKI
jgi:transcriptional regulator with XRE-family HTH domain